MFVDILQIILIFVLFAAEELCRMSAADFRFSLVGSLTECEILCAVDATCLGYFFKADEKKCKLSNSNVSKSTPCNYRNNVTISNVCKNQYDAINRIILNNNFIEVSFINTVTSFICNGPININVHTDIGFISSSTIISSSNESIVAVFFYETDVNISNRHKRLFFYMVVTAHTTFYMGKFTFIIIILYFSNCRRLVTFSNINRIKNIQNNININSNNSIDIRKINTYTIYNCNDSTFKYFFNWISKFRNNGIIVNSISPAFDRIINSNFPFLTIVFTIKFLKS
uniref:Uncharacterized protein n=1 Tax=Magallana gigas TaxID=29159 RepID=K1PTR5_MAGGI